MEVGSNPTEILNIKGVDAAAMCFPGGKDVEGVEYLTAGQTLSRALAHNFRVVGAAE
jgi:hypothetical protein